MKIVVIKNRICRFGLVCYMMILCLYSYSQIEINKELTDAINKTKDNWDLYKKGFYENLVTSESLSSEIIKKYLGEKSLEYRTSVFNLSLYLSESDSIEAAIRNLEYVQQSIVECAVRT